MLLFVVFVTFYCEQVESLGFSDPAVQGAYLQQFGYEPTTATVPTGINVLPERIKSGTYEDISFRAISPDTIRKLQQYAGVKQTGMFDNATIGMMMTARCQNPDIMDDNNKLTKFFLGKKSRTKRDAAIGGSIREWKKLDLTVAFESTTPQNSQAQEVISSAFAAWSECSKLSFKVVDLSDSPDIKVKFASGLHEPPANCEFDGPEGVKAHAFYPPLGMAHFDEDEDWTDNCVLYTVALHEIGHLLGLGHSFHKTSIMFAYFNTEFVKSQCKGGVRLLASNDINNIRARYGAKSCDKAEDIVTEGPTSTSPPDPSGGNLVNVTYSSSPKVPPTETTSAIQMTTNTPSGSIFVTYGTDSWQLECGKMEENILSSPYYPEVYPNGMNCTWNVRAPPGMRAVSMHFIRFEVEDGGEECIYDYLQVTLEDGTSQKLCGSQTKSLTFESKSLTVNFVSDVLKQEVGFRILFTYEVESPKPPCRVVVEDSEGLLTQEHPKLDSHEECTYHINSTDPNKQILIIIEDIAQHCSKYELLLSEDNEEDNLIGSCSEDSSGLRYFVSTTGSFFIKFRPQDSASFVIKYYTIFADSWKRCSSSASQDYNQEFVESGRWSPKTQNINNSEGYFLNTDCILYIPRNSEGKELTVKLDNLDIEYDKYCSYDFLEIYTAGNNQPQRYCGQEDRIEFTTFGDTLIYFHSDYSVVGSAFVLEYGVTECVHDLPDSRESANKISNVSLEGDCSYSFDMVTNKHFVCADFAAQGDCRGYVAVGASGGRYCKPFSTVINGNEAVNISSLSTSHSYSMKYVTIDSVATNCYRTIQVTSTRDRGLSFKPPRDKLCAVHFIGKAGYQLVVTFNRVSLKQSCQSDLEYIKMFTGNNGCQGERGICSTQGNADIRLQSQDAYVLSYLTDRKSNFKLRVRLESQKVPTSFCSKSCGQGTAITDVTVEPASTSSYRTSPYVETFRLVDGDGNDISGEGRGLLLYKGGTVCDDYFDDNAADAICKEMGYDESESWDSSTHYSYSSFQDTLEISLDDVNCGDGNWSSCSYSETHNCAHREDVFLACSRLVSTSEPTGGPINPTEGPDEVDIDSCFVENTRTSGVVIAEVAYQGIQHCVDLCLSYNRSCQGIAISPLYWDRTGCHVIGEHTIVGGYGWRTANRTCIQGRTAVQYNITYSIWDHRHARTQNPQYVTIKGTNGETEEKQCDADFNVINQNVSCVFQSDVNIGDYRCVSLRTGGSDGLDLIKIEVQIDGKETHTIVPQGNADYIGLDDGQTKEFCLDGTDWTMKVICDDQMNLWIDGKLTTVAGQGGWNQLSTLRIPESTRSIGVKCKNNQGPYGIMGSIQDADGNDVLVTDNSWSCSNAADDGWERPDFVEGDNWNAASYYPHRDYITDGGPWKEISANSHIIWTADATDTTVYCHKVLQQEQEMLTIASAEMKNSWRSFPPLKLVDGNLNNFAHSIPEEDGMWVRVNLLQPSLVTKVIVYNRQDCCKDRIVGASVFIKSGGEYVTDCGKINSVRDSYEFNCIGEGGTIEIKQDGKVGSWNIAEIQVYGTHDDESNLGRSNKIFRLVDRHGDAVTSGERGLLIYNGGTVCDDGFGDREADAICRELGHEGTASWESGSFYQDFQGSLEIRLDNVNCAQQTWSSCSYLESHNCGHSEDVFLTCSENDETISFAIVDENGNTGSNSGLLLYNGGTVCDDSFNENSAETICTILGFESGESEWSSGSLWGIQSDYTIALDDVRCQDGSWSSCTYSEVHNCGHSEDVFLSCGVGGD